MTDSDRDKDELKTLQREAAKLRAAGRRSAATAGKGAGAEREQVRQPASAEPEAAASPPAEATGDREVTESAKAVRDLAGQIECAVGEIEEVTREHPTLALLAAFGLGVAAGRLFGRR